MSDDRLRELYTLAQAGRPAGRGGEHPTPETIAALVRREGPEEARLVTLDHVMSCADCRRDFDLLRAVERSGVDSGVAGRAGGRRAWLMPAALAASFLLAVGLGRTVLRSGGDDTTRGDSHGAVVLVQPGREARAGDALTFSWRAVPGASRYEIELLDADGGVVVSAATPDTTVSSAATRALPPGDYRWWVRATTPDARSLRSALRPLRLVAR